MSLTRTYETMLPAETGRYIPHEILKIIVSFLAVDTEPAWDNGNKLRKSCKNLRLASKALATLTTPYLFEEMPLWLSVESLQNLIDISEHPSLNQHVKRIVFSPIRFRSQNCGQFRGATDQHASQGRSLTSYDLKRARVFAAQQAYVAQQDYLEEGERNIMIIAGAFQGLPNLDTIAVLSNRLRIGAQEMERNLIRLENPGFVIDDAGPICAVMEAAANLPAGLKHFAIGSTTISNQMFNHKGQLITESDDRSFKQEQIASVLRLHYCENFTKPKTLNITGIRSWDGLDDLESAIAELLQVTDNLEQLFITKNVREGFDGGLKYLSLEGIFPSGLLQLEYLRQLNLSYMDSWGNFDLASLLLSGRHSLEKVGLDILGGDPEYWVDTLQQMKQESFPSLKEFTLSDSLGTGEDLCAEDFFTGVSDVNPVQRYIDDNPDVFGRVSPNLSQ